MPHTLVALVEDRPGVLSRVAGLLRRRNFNIQSLNVGRTHEEGLSRVTLVVDTDAIGVRQVEAHLAKLLCVLEVQNLTATPAVKRDLALIKVRAPESRRPELFQLLGVFRAQVVDITGESLVAEVTGSPEKIERLVDLLRPYGIEEMVQTGLVAMARGVETCHELPITA